MAIDYKGTMSFEIDPSCQGTHPTVCIPIFVKESKTVCEVELVMESTSPSCELIIERRPAEVQADLVRLQFDQILISPLVPNLVVQTACESESTQTGHINRKFLSKKISKIMVQTAQAFCEYTVAGHTFKGMLASHYNLYQAPLVLKRRWALEINFNKKLLKKTKAHIKNG